MSDTNQATRWQAEGSAFINNIKVDGVTVTTVGKFHTKSAAIHNLKSAPPIGINDGRERQNSIQYFIGPVMEYKKARKIAVKYWNLLKPFCMDKRIKVGGSVRRECLECGDIEIVCIPLTIQIQPMGLFVAPKVIRDQRFVNLVNSFPRVKGTGEGKYCQLILPEKINLDLFMCEEDNWGVIWMLRTGSAAFSKRMVTQIKDRGFYCFDGHLYKSGTHEMIPVKEEIDFFTITGLEFVKPNERFL